MISIKSNMGPVAAGLIQKLEALSGSSSILRQVTLTVAAEVVGRIHERGIAADGNDIGIYSKPYMAVRTGIYGNSGKVSRGPNKGKVKNVGAYSRGPNKGTPRPRYNRSNDRKVIVSLTRKLENDWGVVGTDRGWGIGFSNPLNLQKLRNVEHVKKRVIGNLTAGERSLAVATMQRLVDESLR